MNRWTLLAFLQTFAALSAPRAAGAQAVAGESFAIIVGSNPGGPGQDTLRYAEEDAERVADVLLEIGDYQADHVERLLSPSVDTLLAAIERMDAQLTALAQRGQQSRFFFYYSGHARADALNLGRKQLPLSELRRRLLGLSTTLSIVVLDACQSGAFSRVKGASAASDFSFNSVERLNTAGVAVIASSTAGELSQESEHLRSGFFTHHWLVGLRGAADRDADGRVTLSEAYQYAYNHTLATTAATKLGEQHATLETNFKGKDDVPLTRPAAASARLQLPAAMSGRVLVQRLPSLSVVAELDKPAGQTLLLAVPAGSYSVTLRPAGSASRCALVLRDGSETWLDPARCTLAPLEDNASRGRARQEGFVLEVGIGAGWGSHDDAYVRRLRDFQFVPKRSGAAGDLRFALSLGRRVQDHLVLGLEYFNLESREFQRDLEFVQRFSWNAHALGAFAQADAGFGRQRLVNVFVRAGAGASLAWTSFDAVTPENDFQSDSPSFRNTTEHTRPVSQQRVRFCGWLGAGLHIMPSRFIGFQLEFRYVIAPGPTNDFHEVHDLGGAALTAGLRLRTLE